MKSSNLSWENPSLEEAIDFYPLVVQPETPLTEVISLMNQRQSSHCLLPNWEENSSSKTQETHKSNCILVVEKTTKIIGIFTERDLVRLIASNSDLDGMNVDKVMTREVITLNHKHFRDIFAALFLFRRYRIRHLPIVNDRNQLLGVVSHESLRACLRPSNLLKLRRVADIMASNVIQASVTTSVLNLVKLMSKGCVSCVVIMEQLRQGNSIPVGIVTERDILQFQGLKLDLANIQAQEVMSTPLFLLTPEDSLWYAHQQMQKMRLRRLVVSWNWGEGLGIVTQTSLLKVFDPMEMYGVIETLQQTVDNLENNKNEDSVTLGNNNLKYEQSQLDLDKNQSDKKQELAQILQNLETTTQNLITNPEITQLEQINHLKDNLTQIQQIKNLVMSLK